MRKDMPMKTNSPNKNPGWLVWLSHAVLPLVFYSLARWSIRQHQEITWPLLVALAVGSLPFVLVLLARYVKKLKIGGAEYEAPEDETISKEQVAELAKVSLPKKADSAEKPSVTFGKLSRHAKKVLRTLSIFQRQQFGSDEARRWGFLVNPAAPDYVHFRIGTTELRELGLVIENDRGMVFLSDEGMAFCKRTDIKNAIDDGGDFWSKFGSE